jgi:hypothetical protein
MLATKKEGQTLASVPLELLARSTRRTQILCRAHRTPLLEALPAKHRAPLRRPERNGRFLAALRAICFRFRPHRTATPAAFSSFRLAGFATLRFVLETFVGEKHLFAGGKYELCTTLGTLQDLIVIFHEPLSP